MKDSPALSVLIPSYRSIHIYRTLDSLRCLGPVQVIIVDSSPEPPELGDRDVTLIHSKSRLNPGAARNLCARHALGEWIFFLDSDVVLCPESAAVVQVIINDPGAEFCSGIYDHNQSADSFFSRLQDRILLYRMQRKASDGTYLFSSSHFLIRKRIFDEVGGFNAALRTYEDMEFIARCRKMGYQPRFVPELKGIHLKHYSIFEGLKDYAQKGFNAFMFRRRCSPIFQGHPSYVGPGLVLSWMAAIFVVPVGLAILLWSGSWISACTAGAFLWISVMPFLIHLTGRDIGLSLKAWLIWPCIGYVMAATSSVAMAVWFARRLIYWTLFMTDFLRAGWRVFSRSGMPIQMIMYVTARCNLRCEHCFYKETMNASDSGELSLSIFDKVTRSIGPVLWFSLAGGEPFLRKDLVNLISIVQRNSRPKVFSFPTNGWYTERTFETCLRALEVIENGNLILFFSVDGPKNIHDTIRGQGSYEHVKKTVERLRPLQKIYPNLYLNLVTTITERNADIAAGLMNDLIHDFQPNAISINLFRNHFIPSPRLSDRLIEGYKAAVDVYTGRLKGGDLKHYGFIGGRILLSKEILQKELIYRIAKHNEFLTPCTAGTLSYVVMEDGRIKSCEILSDTIGNIKDQGISFADIARSPQARKLRARIRDTKCRCTYECAMSTNTLFSWPMSKRLALSFFKSLFESYRFEKPPSSKYMD